MAEAIMPAGADCSKNIFFVGTCAPQFLQDKVKDWGSPTDFAGYAFQMACLDGLGFYFPNIKVLSTLWLTPFPKSRKMYIPQCRYSHNQTSAQQDLMLGVINIIGINRLSRYFRLKRALRRELTKGAENIVILYSLTSYHLLAIMSQRRKISNLCVIVPDLPEFMSDPGSILRRFAKMVDRKLIMRALKGADSFVLLSDYMAERLPIGDKPWRRVEGICGVDMGFGEVEKFPQKTILYSGALGRRYGVLDLLNAFLLIKDPDYRFFFCGTGEMVDEIISASKRDSRVAYLGVLPREEVLRLQRRVTLLVNPRHRQEEYTKYSFPSKTMEYMASGTPTLMSHLASIPKEYDAFLYYFDDESVSGMARKIMETCEKDAAELLSFGAQARNFILSEKNAIKQAGIIADMISF